MTTKKVFYCSLEAHKTRSLCPFLVAVESRRYETREHAIEQISNLKYQDSGFLVNIGNYHLWR